MSDDLMQPTQEQIEARFRTISANPVPVKIAGLPGLHLRCLKATEQAHVQIEYATSLTIYQKAGHPSKYFLPSNLRQAVEANGRSMDVLNHKARLAAKTLAAIPHELQGQYDRLTPEEVAQLPEQAREKRRIILENRYQEIMKAVANCLTPEERELQRQIEEIEALENSLLQLTAEFCAERDRTYFEILTAAVTESGTRYFKDFDELLRIKPQKALVELISKWRMFQQGHDPDFFSLS